MKIPAIVFTLALVLLVFTAAGGRGPKRHAPAAPITVETHVFTVGDPAQNFAAYATYDYSDACSNGTWDIELHLLLPDGRLHVEDNDPNCGEALFEYAPLPLGNYTLSVVSTGVSTPAYDLLYGTGPAGP